MMKTCVHVAGLSLSNEDEEICSTCLEGYNNGRASCGVALLSQAHYRMYAMSHRTRKV